MVILAVLMQKVSFKSLKMLGLSFFFKSQGMDLQSIRSNFELFGRYLFSRRQIILFVCLKDNLFEKELFYLGFHRTWFTAKTYCTIEQLNFVIAIS